jgi:hypothetical protein
VQPGEIAGGRVESSKTHLLFDNRLVEQFSPAPGTGEVRAGASRNWLCWVWNTLPYLENGTPVPSAMVEPKILYGALLGMLNIDLLLLIILQHHDNPVALGNEAN